MSENYRSYKCRVVRQRLESKGFVNTHTGNKFFLMFYYEGRKTRSHTIINLRPNSVIGKGIFSTISSQLFLENHELIDYIECDITEEDYINILREKEIIQ